MAPIHLTARTLPWRIDLLEPQVAVWLWHKLRRGFPEALAACLMPRHIHLVVAEDPAWAQERLRRTLAWHARRFCSKELFRVWEPIPKPAGIHGADKLARQVRYVALNPCRAGYAGDPLQWYWSTHRDVMGATADPWVEADRLAAALDQPADGFPARHHRYVSGDPSVDPVGTPPPEPGPESRLARHPLDALVQAATIATRSTAMTLRSPGLPRRVFLHLASRRGWTNTTELASLCGITARSVRRLLTREPPVQALGAAALCLEDARLREPARRAASRGGRAAS